MGAGPIASTARSNRCAIAFAPLRVTTLPVSLNRCWERYFARDCGSSQQTIHFAAASVVAGHHDVVVTGGVESMSRNATGASLANGGHPYPEAD